MALSPSAVWKYLKSCFSAEMEYVAPEDITPEDIANWLVIQQTTCFDATYSELQFSDAFRLPSLKEFTEWTEATFQLSRAIALAQLAIIAFTNEPSLDAPSLAGGRKTNRPDLVGYAKRIYEHAQKTIQPLLPVTAGSKNDRNSWAVGGFSPSWETVRGDFCLYFCSIDGDLSSLELANKKAIEFTRSSLASTNSEHAGNPLSTLIALSYYKGHEMWMDRCNAHEQLMIQRASFGKWRSHLMGLNGNLLELTKDKRLGCA